MAYTILNTDGTTLMLLSDGQADTAATSLTLIGRNYSNYGQELNNNFIKLLANFANSSGSPPKSPLTGQLWYDTTIKRIRVYDNGFKTVGAVEISSTQPFGLQSGDLWFDSGRKQLKLYSAGLVYTIGPAIPPSIASTGILLPETTIKDTNDIAKNVVLVRSYGETLAVLYYDSTGNKAPFNINSTDKNTYMPNATTSTVVSGMTIIGDLNVTGKLSNSYLSTYVDINFISPNPNNDVLSFYGGSPAAVSIQNPAIANILNQIYPVNPSTLTNTSTVMTGVLLGTQARVLCKFTSIDGVSRNGYQVRVFRTVGNSTTATWEPYYFTTASLSGNIVAVNYISTTTG